MNQLYWQRRSAYKKLMAAADARRAAHAKRLSGKNANIAEVEADHGAALKAAADEIRTLLTDAGESATPATMQAVNETLQALSGSTPPGRLARPLKLAGFEALAGLVPANARALRGLTPQPREASSAKPERDDAAHRKAVAGVERELREATADVKKAESALAAARKVLAREKADRDRLQDQLQFAMKKIDDASSDVRECERALAEAGQQQSHLESKLTKLRE